MFLANNLNKGGSLGGYQISRSLRFNSADSAYLNRTPASASNQKTWTWSGWVKLSAFSADKELFSADSTGGARYTGIRYTGGDALDFVFDDGSGQRIRSSAVYRDPSAWYHVVAAMDTTQATSSNRMKLYVNGVQITVFAVESYPSQNADSDVNSTRAHNLGRRAEDSAAYLNGYMTEVNFIDGQALTPSSFGETNAQTGVWQPKAYSGSYGTNGFYLNFSDNSNTTAATLGKDYSGNGNNWTPNNFSVTAGAGNDSLVDSPTSYGTDTGVGGTVRGNYATLNPLNAGNSAFLLNGNLDLVNASDASWRTGVSTIAMSSGKWYAEITVVNNSLLIGIDKASVVFTGTTTFIGGSPTGWGVLYTGQVYNNSGVVYNNTGYSNGDIIGMTFDADTGVLTWYKNNVAMAQTITGLTSGPYVFGFSGSSSAGSGSINFGQRPFAYTAPSGFKALCTQNLPTPTIGATTATQASQYFNPVLYTGDRTDRTITVGFQPDWVWVKSRNAADDHYLMNAVVGTGKYLSSNSTAAETTNANSLTAYTSTGFSIGNTGTTNETGRTYVAWNWKANGSGSTNTAGSITSTVSANTTSGFSVVTFTANTAADQTVGHGLGVAPSMIIAKSRNTGSTDWPVYLPSLGINQFLLLNSTAATNTAVSGYWGTSNPTSTVFGVKGGGYGNNIGTMVAYCFAEVAGYSKFGSYTGNGSSDGVFVYTGFRPAYVLIKRTTSAYDWWILDAARATYNAVKGRLYANSSDAESTTYPYMDFLSNGFKLRDADGGNNANGEPYIYACFAQNPFKYSLAR
jgi:hypothetical protein